jgi:branched-chain amino acid aminotransferase
LYGSGAFTTLRVVDEKIFGWLFHRARLQRSLEILGFKAPASHWQADILRLLKANRVNTAQVRLAILEGEGDLWIAGKARRAQPQVVIFSKPLAPAKGPARVGLSRWPVHAGSPLAGLKLGAYVEPWLSLGEARSSGWQEAIRLNEHSQIAGGCRSALLWTSPAGIHAPADSCGGVPSSTLAWAEAYLARSGRRVSRKAYSVRALLACRELLLLSAGVGVRSVSALFGRSLPGDAGPLARELQKAYPANSV